VTLPRIRDTLETLGRRCYAILLGATKKNLSSVQELFLLSLWKDIQAAISQGFSILYSSTDRVQILHQAITNPLSLLHIFPGIAHSLTQDPSSKSYTEKVFFESISSNDDVINFLTFVKHNYILKIISTICGGKKNESFFYRHSRVFKKISSKTN
jgi:hypothetical protein